MAASPRFSTALVLGASSGIGSEIARQLLAKGCRVALVARRGELLAQLASSAPARALVYCHDVQEVAAVAPLLARVVAELGGRLDLVVYAAGLLCLPSDGRDSVEDELAMVQTNFVGAVAWTSQVLEHFREQGAGTLLGLSSIAGERGRKAFPAYCASKAGLTTYLEGMRNRFAGTGIRIVTAKLGLVDTAMMHGRSERLWLISPEQAASKVLALSAAGRSRSAYVPRRWGALAFALHHTPSWLFQRLPW